MTQTTNQPETPIAYRSDPESPWQPLPDYTLIRIATDSGSIDVKVIGGMLRIVAVDGALDVRPNGSNQIIVNVGEYF